MLNQTQKIHLLVLFIILTAASAITLIPAAQSAKTLAKAQALPGIMPYNLFPNLTFNKPVDIANAGDGRLFIVEQAGLIRVVHGRGPSAISKVFLDINQRVTSGGEKGLLGLAFHPQYNQNGYFYVNYTSGEGEELHSNISRFQVTSDPDLAAPNSEFNILKEPQPYENHNGGDLNFGPDSYLYIGLGDGGSGGDPGNRAQSETELLGKMLRIDVNNTTEDKNYAIPPDNPFIGQPAYDEIWAIGLRNPWRFSFDRLTGDMLIADVGQNEWEEINFQPANSAGGENYGWRLKEGTHCFNPPSNCDPGGLTDPIYEYSHAVGSSITGGYVYRGPSLPALQGTYLYSDWCTGAIYTLYQDGAEIWHSATLINLSDRVSTFGEDNSGELYLAQHSTGKIIGLKVYQTTIFAPIVLSLPK